MIDKPSTTIQLKRKIILGIVFFLAFIMLLFWCSYSKSRSTAISLVGETINEYPLSRTKITILPREKMHLVWDFKFSFPDSYDEEFYIYTTLWGNVVDTNPSDLLDSLEKKRLEQTQYR